MNPMDSYPSFNAWLREQDNYLNDEVFTSSTVLSLLETDNSAKVNGYLLKASDDGTLFRDKKVTVLYYQRRYKPDLSRWRA